MAVLRGIQSRVSVKMLPMCLLTAFLRNHQPGGDAGLLVLQRLRAAGQRLIINEIDLISFNGHS